MFISPIPDNGQTSSVSNKVRKGSKGYIYTDKICNMLNIATSSPENLVLEMDVIGMKWRKIWYDNLDSVENGFECGKLTWYT